jgi:hypothetical protein
MNTIKFYFQKTLSFLRVRSIAGGLEVSDQVLRLVYFNGNAWQMAAIRLMPGILEKGKIKNLEAFVASLRELKTKIPAVRSKKKKMNVVVSLSSVNIYSQVFTLPLLEGNDLKKAVELNVQMLSPGDASKTYSGWQMLGRDEVDLRLEVSVAFIEKQIVDEMVDALLSAGFLTVGVESRALALVRILREKGAGVDAARSYLLLNIDNSGLDFLIVRKGQLYFEYTNQWSDLADDKGQISVQKFEDMLAGSMRQVTNFYSQHWPEPLSAVILSASAFGDEAEKVIGTAAALPITRLTLFMGQAISSEWLVALGCSLRGFNSSSADKEVNLSGEEAMDTFRKEQLVGFLSFWSIFVPVVLALTIVTFALADNFLVFTAKGIASQSVFNEQGQELQDVAILQASSTAFNESVELVQNTEKQLAPRYPIISMLTDMASSTGVSLNHISFPGPAGPILIGGTASSEPQIVALKTAIAADPSFGPVTLPISGIQLNGGVYSFTMTFPF